MGGDEELREKSQRRQQRAGGGVGATGGGGGRGPWNGGPELGVGGWVCGRGGGGRPSFPPPPHGAGHALKPCDLSLHLAHACRTAS